MPAHKKTFENIDVEQLIKQYGALHVPKVDLCKVLRISIDTFDRNKEWCELYEIAKVEGKTKLRQKQIEVAMDGQPSLLIFLGKAMLGQTDTQNIKISSPKNESLNVSHNIQSVLSNPDAAKLAINLGEILASQSRSNGDDSEQPALEAEASSETDQ